MVINDSMMMTLGVMKMAHDFPSNEEVSRLSWSHCVESEKFGGHVRLQMDDQ